MKTVGLVLGLLFLVGVIAVIGFGIGYWNWSNDCHQFEADIPAQYTQMKNAYDNGWKKVTEIAQVPSMQMDNYKQVYDGVMKGRYGANGSGALLQFIKEQNPTLDASLYTKVQQTVETFHDQFQASQTQIIAFKQSYQKLLTVGGGRIYNMIGSYPHIRCGVPAGAADDFQIVTSGKTETDFQNHQSAPLDLRHPENNK
jgi:hypothetical protein